MHITRLSLTALVLLIGNGLAAMEGQAPQAPEQRITVQQLLGMACSQSTPFTREQKLEFAQLIDESQDFQNMSMEAQPAVFRVQMEELTATTGTAHTVLTEQYRASFAPFTGAASAACCVLTYLKPYLCGLLDTVPTHEATIGLASYWAAQVNERQPQRTCVNNGFLALELIDTKAASLVKARIAILKKEKLEKEKQAQAAQEEETKKDK